MQTKTETKKRKNETAPACCDGLTQRLDPEFFKALCDPTRLALLAFLANGAKPMRVSEAAQCCPIDISVVSRHLAVLKQAGIVQSEKRGKEVFYQVRFAPIVETLRGLADALESCCPESCNPTDRKEINHA